MTNKQKGLAAGAAGIVILAWLGGSSGGLEVKGLRLGMPVEEAARVMLGHGFDVGGRSDPGHNAWANREFQEAVRGGPSQWDQDAPPRDLEEYVARRYPDGRPFHLGEPWDGEAPLELDGRILPGEGWRLFVDDERRVTTIELRSEALARLFGAGDMSAEEFAASFARAYGVPLEPTARVMGADMIAITGRLLDTGWVCMNRDAGWVVKLSDHKVLEIDTITPKSQQSFD
jgi:hypothetical protein